LLPRAAPRGLRQPLQPVLRRRRRTQAAPPSAAAPPTRQHALRRLRGVRRHHGVHQVQARGLVRHAACLAPLARGAQPGHRAVHVPQVVQRDGGGGGALA
jgi:hypothetical protein